MRILIEDLSNKDWSESGHPSVTMHDVRLPAEFLHRLQYSFTEEQAPFIIVLMEVPLLVSEDGLPLEEFLIVDEVDLHPDLRNGGYLDDQWVVIIIDDQIHPGQADDFMKLVPSLVDTSKPWHEHPDLVFLFMHILRKMPSLDADFILRQERRDFLSDVKDFEILHMFRLKAATKI